MTRSSLLNKIEELGALRVAAVAVDEILFDQGFRKLCQSNACGNYGRNWMCPPHVGEIDTLIQQAKGYQHCIVYQTVGALEDSYDFPGMMEAAEIQNQLTQRVRDYMDAAGFTPALHLGAGGCHVCPTCTKGQNQPCPHPEKAIPGLEAYGIDVSALAMQSGLNYINGENTVTYFSAVLLGGNAL